jgi:hypothetical protein
MPATGRPAAGILVSGSFYVFNPDLSISQGIFMTSFLNSNNIRPNEDQGCYLLGSTFLKCAHDPTEYC